MDGATVVEIGNGNNGGEFSGAESFVIDPTDGGIPTIDPIEVTGEGPGESDNGKRRGRPRGSKNRSSQPAKEVSSDLSALLYTTHFMLAKLVKVDELELEKGEAEELGKALARVQREFGVAVLSPKAMALVNLAVVAGGVYVPRAIAFNLNHKKAAAEKQPSKVAQMPAPNMMM
jgi:hypothetical protein